MGKKSTCVVGKVQSPNKREKKTVRKLQRSVQETWEKDEVKKKRYEATHSMWGDSPDDKDSEDIRITSTNINGLSSPAELSEYIISSAQFNSDVNCFQELNIDTDNQDVFQSLRRAVRDVDETRGSTFQATTIIDKRQESHRRNIIKKQGGTLIHLERKWTGSTLKKENDKLGRWSSITIEGRGGRKVSIFSVYRVGNNKLETAGGDTVWFQEYAALLSKGIKDPDPRQQILDDLEKTILRLKEDTDHQIIICIDANESTRSAKSKIQQFIKNTGMIDCHRHFHPDLSETPTHAEGSTQIDYCIITSGIIESVKRCGITALHYDVQGADHRSVWLDLESNLLLKGVHKAPQSPPSRGLKLKNIKALQIFQEQLQEFCRQHRMREKMHRISQSLMETERISDTTEKAQRISVWKDKLEEWDTLMMRLMLAAEKKCSKKGLTRTYLWSRPLVVAGQRITYWKARKKVFSRKDGPILLSGYALHLHETFGKEKNHLDKEEVVKELKEAWKHLRSIQKEDRAHRQAFLEELALERSKQQKIKVESAIRQIMNAEESAESHEKLNYYLRKTSKGAIDYLLIPVGTNKYGPFGKKWEKISDSKQVEQLLLQ